MFLTKIFFKKSPLAETFITCWKIINTLVYISHFAITGISPDWLWPHIFITGEKPSELNNKWTILIAGNGDNLDSICYSGESRHGMVWSTQHNHHHHHKLCGIFKPFRRIPNNFQRGCNKRQYHWLRSTTMAFQPLLKLNHICWVFLGSLQCKALALGLALATTFTGRCKF